MKIVITHLLQVISFDVSQAPSGSKDQTRQSMFFFSSAATAGKSRCEHLSVSAAKIQKMSVFFPFFAMIPVGHEGKDDDRECTSAKSSESAAGC